jgi:hypothetical protein
MFKIDSKDGKFKIEIDEAPIVFYYALLLSLKAIAEKKDYEDEVDLIKTVSAVLSTDGIAEKAIELIKEDMKEELDDNEDNLF